MAILKYPYTNLHELNLDWIIEQLKTEGAVLSVNDKHGIVVLTGEDIPRNTTTPETVAQALSSQGNAIQTVRTQIGTTPLPTTAQSLTGAIAENAQEIADIEDNVIGSTALPTTAQTLTGAIAENAQEISDIEDNVIGNTALPTTAQTLTGAIAENASGITNLGNTITGMQSVDDYTAYGPTYCYLKIKNNVVYIYGTSSGGVTLTGDGAWHTLTTIGPAFRPSYDVYFTGSTAAGKAISFHVSSNGNVDYVTDANTSYWNYGGTYII